MSDIKKGASAKTLGSFPMDKPKDYSPKGNSRSVPNANKHANTPGNESAVAGLAEKAKQH